MPAAADGAPTAAPGTDPTRRRALGIGFGVLAVPVIGAAAFQSVRAAEQGPDVRANLTLIAPAAAGGGWDLFQREMQAAMRTNGLVGNVQVLNVPGADGTIATGSLEQRSTAGYLMVGGTGHLAAEAQRDAPAKLSEVTPVARVIEEYAIVTVPADSPYEDLQSLVDAWLEDPKALAWTGGGSSDQMVMTELALAAEVDPAETTWIPSDGGGEAIQAMLNGSAEASTGGFADMYPQVESGRLRALGIAAKERLDGVDVPTMTEQGFDVTLTNWRAVFAPPIADEDQLADFRALIEETTATKEWKAAVKRNYWVEFPATGQELQDFIDAERTKIGRLIKEMTS